VPVVEGNTFTASLNALFAIEVLSLLEKMTRTYLIKKGSNRGPEWLFANGSRL
jgi:hypothetical protein